MDVEVKNTASEGLRKWSDEARAALRRGLLDAAAVVEAESVRQCPKDTGELRRNYEIIEGDDGSVYVVYEARVPPDQQYGLQVHECPDSAMAFARNVALHRFRGGKPSRGYPWDIGRDHFLSGALRDNEDNVRKIIAGELRKECEG